MQFLRDLPTSGIILVCVASGFLATIAALVTIQAPDLRPAILNLALKLLVVMLLAVGLAVFLSALVLPSGGGH
jgi:hypothetical protein